MLRVLALALSVHCAASFRLVVECKQHAQMALRMALALAAREKASMLPCQAALRGVNTCHMDERCFS